MTELKTKLIPLQIMDVIADEILTRGEYRNWLGVDDLRGLVGEAVQLSMSEYANFEPKINNLLVDITKDGKIIFGATVSTTFPPASVHLRANWMNDVTPGVLKLTGLNLEPDLMAKAAAAAKGINISETLQPVLINPNQTLGNVIRGQMDLKGVVVSAAGFVIEPNQTVRVVVQGKKK